MEIEIIQSHRNDKDDWANKTPYDPVVYTEPAVIVCCVAP